MYLLAWLRWCRVGQQLLERLGPRGREIGRGRSDVVSPHNYDGNDESEAERFSRLSPQSSAGLVAGSGAGAYRVVRRGR